MDRKSKSICIDKNLVCLRKLHHLSLEEVAEKIGVSRQAVAKWESGETIPDILNCDALAAFYDVSLDELLHFNGEKQEIGLGPKGKYFFGTARIGERGQVVIPKQARDIFHLKVGDMLAVLGDETPGSAGIALVPSAQFMGAVKELMKRFYPKEARPEEP